MSRYLKDYDKIISKLQYWKNSYFHSKSFAYLKKKSYLSENSFYVYGINVILLVFDKIIVWLSALINFVLYTLSKYSKQITKAVIKE